MKVEDYLIKFSKESFSMFQRLNWEVPDCGNYWAFVYKILNLKPKVN